jgi:DNA-binding transcriptional regulator LsrR (DeoR family)
LRTADVVHTASPDQVAEKGAETLCKLIEEWTDEYPNKEAVHVGIAGGHMMRRFSQALSRLLRFGGSRTPPRIVFHSLVSGFDVDTPSTDPNGFFTYLLDDPAMAVRSSFVTLRVPPLVEPDQMEEIKSLRLVREAYDQADKLDFVVTSGGHLADAHSALRKMMDDATGDVRNWIDEDQVVDMLWRPIGPDGPIPVQKLKRCAMSLLELDEVQAGIAANRFRVLLVLGPCGACGEVKSVVLETILATRPHLITDLVVDSRSARRVVGKIPT